MNPLTLLTTCLDPGKLLEAQGLAPDPWQRRLLLSDQRRILLNCSRGAGKSRTCSALALHTALFRQGSLVLLLSRALRQAQELLRYVKQGWKALRRPVPALKLTETHLELENGSRIISLPGREDTIRGFQGVALIVIDEAARVPDQLYWSVRPMLNVSQGRLVCLSTPFGARGFFWKEWHSEKTSWQRVCVPWTDCPRLTPADIAEERLALGDGWVAQEYECITEGMDILTSEGVKLIEEIKVGDLVLTHANRYRRVTQVFKRDYHGPRLRIKTSGCNCDVVCTPEHPWRVTEDGWSYSWAQARDLRIGMRVTYPKPALGKYALLSEGMARLLAWYIAEGSTIANAVQFSFSHDETDYHEEVSRLARTELGASVTVSKGRTATVVQVNSAAFREFCAAHCGLGATEKRIPLGLFSGREQLLYDVLMAGDGSTGTYAGCTKDTYSTVSKTLAYQFLLLAHQLGRPAWLYAAACEGESIIEGRTVHTHDRYNVTAYPRVRNNSKRRIRSHKLSVSAPIRSIEEELHEGPVYNLRVEGDESFTVNGRVVHNCSFVARQGAVYPEFAKSETDQETRPEGRLVGGIDFGWRNPFAALWGVLDAHDVLWLVGERYQRGVALHRHAAALKDVGRVTWYADPAGRTEIEELRAAGLTVLPGTNDIRPGIAAVSARLQSGRLKVLKDCCPNLLREARLYRYPSGDEGVGETESPLDADNHALAALRYLVSKIDSHFLARLRQRGDKTEARPTPTEHDGWTSLT